MSRNEKFDDIVNIAKLYPVADGRHGGPIVFYRNGIPYCDPGEMHIAACAISGGGKTQVVVLPFVANTATALESLIIIDPKKEIYNKTISQVEKTHKVVLIDLRSPAKTRDYWNPLKLIYHDFKSGNPEFEDRAFDSIYSLASSLMPKSEKDAFWENAGTELVTGIISALMELCDEPEKVNMKSVLQMLSEGTEKMGAQNYIQHLYKLLPADSFAKMNLSTFVNAPNDTAMSIFSVAKNGLGAFARNRGLLELISQDSIDIESLDNSEKPIAIYIVLPDESNHASELCGVLIKQLSQHFVRLAQTKYDGKLPNRINLVLEELGSIGSAFSNLPNLCVASRSRNIRLLLVLQSLSQLDSLYGAKEAETIRSCIGINFCFTTNHFGTLEEWSKKCGCKAVVKNGTARTEELITPAQIAAMPPLTCLVFLGNRFKYIHHFPLFHESCFHIEERKEVDDEGNVYERKPVPIFSIKNWVEAVKAKEREELFRNDPLLDRMFGGSHSLPVMDTRDNLPKREAPKKDEEDVQKRLDELQRQLESLDKEDE